MESQPQNPEFRINPENFHPWCQWGGLWSAIEALPGHAASAVAQE